MLRFVQKQQEKRAIPPELEALGLPRRLLELLVERGMNTPQQINRYLHPHREDLHDPMLMQDMSKAVSVVRDAVSRGEEIVIFGDYDVDGVTATAILLTYLRKQGAKVSFYIPDRHGEGYGLNRAAVEQIAKHARLLITVDCGITCPDEVALARELGMRVIVTDHHQLGPKLPQCEAVLDPLLGEYPFRRLCGAGVAFKLVQALGGMEAIAPLWELAALATIADIVPLTDENRVIVTFGLADMACTKRPGLIALMESAGVDAKAVTSSDVAFRMAPRINAGGRLALASRGVELLTTRRLDTAREIAQELGEDNAKRRELENEILRQAEERVQTEINFLKDRAIVVCGEGWNPGVIGLAASRLVERYRWPAVLLAQDGDVCVGSARSIPGVNIHQALSECSDLFIRFGGHAQAAGLTLPASHVDAFKRRLTQAILRQTTEETFLPTAEYDLELELPEITEALVTAFDAMQPTGFGNPAPVFCVRGAHTTDVRTIGKDGAHLRLRLAQGGEMRNAIGFRMGDLAPSVPEVVEAIVSLSINVWQDRRSVQCELRQMQAYMPAKAFLLECQRRGNDIDEAFLRSLGLSGTTADASRCERMTLEQAKTVLSEELMHDPQGTLLCVHTVSALKLLNVHLAVIHAQHDYALHTMDDIRAFNTLVMAPDWAKISDRMCAIVALDGFLSDAERAQVCARFPYARIIEVTDMGRHAAETAGRLLPGDNALRAFYRLLRQREQMTNTLEQLSLESGMSTGSALCAMQIFEQMGLVTFTSEPFTYRMIPSGRVSLDDSTLRSLLMQMKG